MLTMTAQWGNTRAAVHIRCAGKQTNTRGWRSRMGNAHLCSDELGHSITACFGINELITESNVRISVFLAWKLPLVKYVKTKDVHVYATGDFWSTPQIPALMSGPCAHLWQHCWLPSRQGGYFSATVSFPVNQAFVVPEESRWGLLSITAIATFWWWA